MKFLSSFLFFLFVIFSHSQEQNLGNTDTIWPVIHLESTTSIRKPITIQKGDFLEFVKFNRINVETDSAQYELSRIRGRVSDYSVDTIALVAHFKAQRTFNNYQNLFNEEQSISGGHYNVKLSLIDVDGVYYSSKLRSKIHNTSVTMLAVSLFTSLVLAPLFSMEYKTYSEGTPGGFNRKQYFTIAGSGLAAAAASFTLFVVSKPRYFSFAGDDFNPKKQRWRLGVAR
mgnify:CR=1 FL=1